MTRQSLRRAIRAVGVGLTIIAALPIASSLTGCKSDSVVTKQEEANFKGGPMPANFHPFGAPKAPPPPAKK